jgi:hypothetical protein
VAKLLNHVVNRSAYFVAKMSAFLSQWPVRHVTTNKKLPLFYFFLPLPFLAAPFFLEAFSTLKGSAMRKWLPVVGSCDRHSACDLSCGTDSPRSITARGQAILYREKFRLIRSTCQGKGVGAGREVQQIEGTSVMSSNRLLSAAELGRMRELNRALALNGLCLSSRTCAQRQR